MSSSLTDGSLASGGGGGEGGWMNVLLGGGWTWPAAFLLGNELGDPVWEDKNRLCPGGVTILGGSFSFTPESFE